MYNKDLPNLKEDAAFLKQEQYDLADFARLIAFLAGDNGCPWDRIQTPDSLKKHLLEESYEAYDAIIAGDENALREELGDVLLQIVFQSNLAKTFTLEDVITTVTEKMISRHTHVFADDEVSAYNSLPDIWEANKRKEKSQSSHSDALAGVARALPALTRAEKLQAKARKAGFDWQTIDGPRDKIDEELEEAEEARQKLLSQADNADEAADELEMETGDLLFSIVNWARHAGVDPERALDRANQKFMGRFAEVERLVNADGRDMNDMDLDELDRYWDQTK